MKGIHGRQHIRCTKPCDKPTFEKSIKDSYFLKSSICIICHAKTSISRLKLSKPKWHVNLTIVRALKAKC